MFLGKKFLTYILLAMLCFTAFVKGAGVAEASSEINVFYKNERLAFDVEPQLVQDRTLVPFRKVFETLGFEVTWSDGEEQEVTGKKEGLSIELIIDSKLAIVNGKTVTLDVPATILDERTLVPLRFVAENSGKIVSYQEEAGKLDIWIDEKEQSGSTVSCKKGESSISGRVTTPKDNFGVAGAKVHLESADCWTETDSSGDFTFNDVPATESNVTVSRGSFKTVAKVKAGDDNVVKFESVGTKIAYMEGAYDQAEQLLAELGFKSDLLMPADLITSKLNEYNILFLNCGLVEILREPEYAAIKSWVDKGGSLYLSDMAGKEMQTMFDDRITFLGGVGEVMEEAKATIVSEKLQKEINKKQLTLTFDLPVWWVIDSVSSNTEVLVKGVVSHSKDAESNGDIVESERPLAARFKYGNGQVTYTSFHDEAQLSADVKLLLRNMILGL